MPTVDIILDVKPENQNFLRIMDYPLGFFEQYAQLQKIQMKFELTEESILVFFKTLADFRRIFKVLSNITLETNPAFIPTEKLKLWECIIRQIKNEDREAFLNEFPKVLGNFLGHFGRVEVFGEKIMIFLPENFMLDKFFKPPVIK